MHDQIDFDNVSRAVVIHDARIDRFDLFRERHGFVDDELLEFEGGRSSGEVGEVGLDCVSPDEDEDD